MTKTTLMACLLVLLTATTAAQSNKLEWNSSFTPPWANGILHRNAPNVGGNALDCDAAINLHGGGSFTLTMGTYGVLSPTVAGAVFTVPGSPERIQLTPDYNNTNAYTTITLEFTSVVTNVNFKIVDIDKDLPTSETYFDRITVTGIHNNTNHNPVITKYDPTTDPGFLVINGNSAWVNTNSGVAGNAQSDASDQRGTVNVDFGSTPLTSIIIRYDNAPGSNHNPDAQSIAIGEVSFGQYTLPVRLGNFSGHRQGQSVVLNWNTEQEFNSSAFEIERSNAINNWEKIGTVGAAGNSSTVIEYNFTDHNPQGTILLYRLKQLDIDDHYKYSSIVRISSQVKKADIHVYPNPSREKISVGLYSPVQQAVTVALVDPSGRTVRNETKYLFAGENNIMLTLSGDIPKSVYQLVVYDAGGNSIGRTQFIKE